MVAYNDSIFRIDDKCRMREKIDQLGEIRNLIFNSRSFANPDQGFKRITWLILHKTAICLKLTISPDETSLVTWQAFFQHQGNGFATPFEERIFDNTDRGE